MSDGTAPAERLRDWSAMTFASDLRARAATLRQYSGADEWDDARLMDRAADAIDALELAVNIQDRMAENYAAVELQRLELAAVIEAVKNLLAEASRFRESDIDTWVNALALKNVLYPAPTDALREHDRVVAERAWDEGVELALNFAKRNPDGVTLRLEKPNPYRKEQENGDPR